MCRYKEMRAKHVTAGAAIFYDYCIQSKKRCSKINCVRGNGHSISGDGEKNEG